MKSLDQLYIDFSKAGGRYSYAPPLTQWSDHPPRPIDYSDQTLLDLYLHLPFCPKLCTFCGCNITITQDTQLMSQYLAAILKEWQLKRPKEALIQSLNLGGGTPNFLSPKELALVIKKIITSEGISLSSSFFLRIEADPRLDILEFLNELYGCQITGLDGQTPLFIQFGVQDLNQKVLHNINRPQNSDQIYQAMAKLKESFPNVEITCDMIYGLSFQRPALMKESMNLLCQMPIDGVSFYPLAQVPWQKKNQLLYGEIEKIDAMDFKDIFLAGKEVLEQSRFFNLGLGHFVHQKSRLATAFLDQTLKRTLMGYALERAPALLSLGVSAIGYSSDQNNQNTKILKNYFYQLDQSQLPLERSRQKNATEILLENIYQKVSTKKSVSLRDLSLRPSQQAVLVERLRDYCHHKLFLFEQDMLTISTEGRDFIKILAREITQLILEES